MNTSDQEEAPRRPVVQPCYATARYRGNVIALTAHGRAIHVRLNLEMPYGFAFWLSFIIVVVICVSH
jgi:hypothetical protein